MCVCIYIYIYINDFSIKGPWVKLSRRLSIKFYGYDSSHPLESRACLGQTLLNPNSYYYHMYMYKHITIFYTSCAFEPPDRYNNM